jgi:hypothetical protein
MEPTNPIIANDSGVKSLVRTKLLEKLNTTDIEVVTSNALVLLPKNSFKGILRLLIGCERLYILIMI